MVLIGTREATMADGKVVGYARVSTMDQQLDSQLDQLLAAGCSKIYSEKRSGVDTRRPESDDDGARARGRHSDLLQVR
ncbi:recombinase family protein [Geomonas diazotrophica]|uniref:recombinase family protein n=1 Tax=Geomonas diazotrophica TaxID=2843197 RepID=UPI002E28E0B5|nr:recombinase family protein [Geomonas diazotrophica]